MATIKDIAKAAGVSQGTVSNVLSGKGNVSSEKIRLVQAAAEKLGYTVNERARLLRAGQAKILAVVLPNIKSRPYVDFYLSFKKYAEDNGFLAELYLTEDDPATEESIISQMRSAMVTGAAVFTCHMGEENPYAKAGFAPGSVLFVERRPHFASRYMGFDYARCGSELAERALEKGYTSVSVLTGNPGFSHEEEVLKAFRLRLVDSGCTVNRVRTDYRRSAQNLMEVFGTQPVPEALFLTRYGLAETAKDVWLSFYRHLDLTIHTLSPLFTLPENDFVKYELNYRLMGRTAAEELIVRRGTKHGDRQVTLENYGFRNWRVPPAVHQRIQRISVLTLDSPEAFAMQSLARRYTQSTGTEVNILVYSYNEIHEILSYMEQPALFDVLRLDVSLLSWFAGKVLRPLDEIDPQVGSRLGQYLEGVVERYARVDGKIYALPATPSVQLLYYRKDLFESTALRRIYQETYREDLRPPKTFRELNQIARFFTRRQTPASPVEHGTSLTLGNTGVVGSEFLVRFFSYSENLYDENLQVRLNGPAGHRALEDLVELWEIIGGHTNNWWTDSAAEFAGGHTAMAILYSNFASDLLRSSSQVITKVGFAPVPGANPMIGGGALGISRHCGCPEEALRFINWICDEPAASAATLLGGASACRKTYENYEIVDAYPWLALAGGTFATIGGLRKPPECERPFDERRLLNIIAMALRSALNKSLTTREALDYAQSELEKSFVVQY